MWCKRFRILILFSPKEVLTRSAVEHPDYHGLNIQIIMLDPSQFSFDHSTDDKESYEFALFIFICLQGYYKNIQQRQI